MLKQCLKNKAHFPLRHLENKILTEPQPKKAKLLSRIRKSKLYFLMLDRDSINIWKRIFSSLWDTWRIKFSQSHSLKRLSCSVASGRPNCFTKCWTSTTIDVSFRISFVCKIKGRSSPSSVNYTKMHWREFLKLYHLHCIIDHKLWITSSTFESRP